MSIYSNQIVSTKLAEYERCLHAKGFSKSNTATSEKDLQPLEYFVTFGTSDPNKFAGEEMANVICRKD